MAATHSLPRYYVEARRGPFGPLGWFVYDRANHKRTVEAVTQAAAEAAARALSAADAAAVLARESGMTRTRWHNSTRIVLGMASGIFLMELLQVWPATGMPPYYSLVLRTSDGNVAHTLPCDRATAASLVSAAKETARVS